MLNLKNQTVVIEENSSEDAEACKIKKRLDDIELILAMLEKIVKFVPYSVIKKALEIKIDQYVKESDLLLRKLSMHDSDKNQNNHEIFHEYFEELKEEQKISTQNKPLCIYAINKQYDHNGSILSEYGLEKIKHNIKNLNHYRVLPILFDNKTELNEHIINCFNQYKTTVSLLVLHAHSNSNKIRCFSIEDGCKIPYLTLGSSIILDGCNTAGGKIENSIAYKLAQYNLGVKVFGAANSITSTEIVIEENDGKPQVKQVHMIDYDTPVASYCIYVQKQKEVEEDKHVQIS